MCAKPKHPKLYSGRNTNLQRLLRIDAMDVAGLVRRCAYVVPRKKRKCRMMVKGCNEFCGEHAAVGAKDDSSESGSEFVQVSTKIGLSHSSCPQVRWTACCARTTPSTPVPSAACSATSRPARPGPGPCRSTTPKDSTPEIAMVRIRYCCHLIA